MIKKMSLLLYVVASISSFMGNIALYAAQESQSSVSAEVGKNSKNTVSVSSGLVSQRAKTFAQAAEVNKLEGHVASSQSKQKKEITAASVVAKPKIAEVVEKEGEVEPARAARKNIQESDGVKKDASEVNSNLALDGGLEESKPVEPVPGQNISDRGSLAVQLLRNNKRRKKIESRSQSESAPAPVEVTSVQETSKEGDCSFAWSEQEDSSDEATDSESEIDSMPDAGETMAATADAARVSPVATNNADAVLVATVSAAIEAQGAVHHEETSNRKKKSTSVSAVTMSSAEAKAFPAVAAIVKKALDLASQGDNQVRDSKVRKKKPRTQEQTSGQSAVRSLPPELARRQELIEQTHTILTQVGSEHERKSAPNAATAEDGEDFEPVEDEKLIVPAAVPPRGWSLWSRKGGVTYALVNSEKNDPWSLQYLRSLNGRNHTARELHEALNGLTAEGLSIDNPHLVMVQRILLQNEKLELGMNPKDVEAAWKTLRAISNRSMGILDTDLAAMRDRFIQDASGRFREGARLRKHVSGIQRTAARILASLNQDKENESDNEDFYGEGSGPKQWNREEVFAKLRVRRPKKETVLGVTISLEEMGIGDSVQLQ